MSPKLKPPSLGEIAADKATRSISATTRRRDCGASSTRSSPRHWSFLLGEIALYSFIVLLLTGVYLTLFFDPSMTEVIYDGVYQPLRGVEMSRAYETALNISFEVRGGLFVRQIHHWAALLFAASIMVHLARIFFTGAFRRPREANWVIGALLLILAMFEGFFGYSLPDDLLSGIGLRAALSSITLGMPVIGTWLHWALFGGDFPGNIIIPRLYVVHILLFPAIMLALIGVHLALVWYPEAHPVPRPGPHRDTTSSACAILPVFAVKSGAFFAMIVGILGLMGGLLQINPIWQLGPYKPSQISAGSPARLLHDVDRRPGPHLPRWEIYLGNYTIPAVVWVAVIMGLVFMLLIIYPFIEQRVTGDDAHHNLLQRPRDVPVRTAIGAMAIAFYMVLTLSAMNDIIALKFHISLNATTWIGRIGMVVLPPIVYFIAYRWACLAAQRPRGARARRRDRHHQAAAARRLHRAAPAAGAGRRPRPPDSAGVPGRCGAEADEQARLGRRARPGQLPDCRPTGRATGPHRGGARPGAPALTALRERQADVSGDGNGSSPDGHH